MFKRQMLLSPLVQVNTYKHIDTRHSDTHEHSTSYTRHAVVHESVILLVAHLPGTPHPAVTSPAVTTSLSLSFAITCTNSEIFSPVSDVLFYNHSTQILTKMSDHLWVDPLQLSCPEEQGSHCGFLPVCVLVCVFISLPLLHTLLRLGLKSLDFDLAEDTTAVRT